VGGRKKRGRFNFSLGLWGWGIIWIGFGERRRGSGGEKLYLMLVEL